MTTFGAQCAWLHGAWLELNSRASARRRMRTAPPAMRFPLQETVQVQEIGNLSTRRLARSRAGTFSCVVERRPSGCVHGHTGLRSKSDHEK